MLLFFRFFRVILSGLLGRRRGVLDESVLRFRVMPTDIDFNLHLNDGRYMSFMGIGRSDVLTRCGLLTHAVRRKWAPVIGGAMIRYRREVRPLRTFTLRSRIVGWDPKWVYFEHIVESEGSMRAMAYVRGVLRGHDGPVPTETVLREMGWPAESPQLPDVALHWPELA